MDTLSKILALSEGQKKAKGLVHTPGEIYRQPMTWEISYRNFLRREPETKDFLAEAVINVGGKTKPTVILVGAGTSHYVGRSLTHLLRRKWGCEVLAVPSTDLLTDQDGLILPGRPYLWISFSRSGDSSEGVAILQSALNRYPEIRHLIVSCNKDGQMIRQFEKHPAVFCLVLDDATNDKGLAMTASYSNMVVTGHCLAHFQALSEYEDLFRQLCTAGKNFLGPAADLSARLAEEQYSKACFLGTGPLNAVAQESGLKLLELSAGKTQTMSETSLGIRHGPLSALDDETLLISFLSGDWRRRRYELDLLEEIKKKQLGRKLVVVSANDDASHLGLAHCDIPVGVPDAFPDEYRPPVDVMFGQLLALFTSLKQGVKPDTPSPSGAISRVVSHLNIYE